MIKKILLGILISISLQCSMPGKTHVRVLENVSAKGELGSEVYYKIEDKTLTVFNDKFSFVEFPVDRSFLTVAKGTAKIDYNLAAFKFKDKYSTVCRNQSIDKIDKIQNGIKISGILHDKDCYVKYEIDLVAENKQSLNFNVTLSEKSYNRISLVYRSVKEEQFFGFGEQYTHFNMKGKKPFIFTEEQGIGRGDQPITFGANLTQGAGGNEYTSYAPMPHYITTNNRSVYFENSAYSKFNFENEEYVKVLFWENNLKGTIWVSDKPLELIEMYTAKTGRYQGLPDWAYGTWLGLQGGTDKVKKIIKEAKLAGNPVTALWIQDWVGRRVTGFGDQLKWRWYAQETSELTDSSGQPEPSYPDFKNFTAEMNKDGVKVLGYINSFLAAPNAPTSPKQPIKEPNSCGYKRFIPFNGCKPERIPDSFTNPMLEEAKAKGYLVKNQAGEDYIVESIGFPAYLIDLTNPEAVKWTKDIIKKNMIDQGLSGWMADFGEWLPYDAKLHSGISAEVYHNLYPVDWARINREAIQEAGKEGEIVFFTRAGYTGSNRYSTAFWLGDQMVSFGVNDGLASTIVGLNSGGISGIAINHSDIGGYTGLKDPPWYFKNYNRTEELNRRWSELNAFTPIYRTHEGNVPSQFNQVYSSTYNKKIGKDGKPILYPENNSDINSVRAFARFGKIHYALKEYFSFLVDQAKEKGYPVIRHPYLNYPSDPNTYNLKYQFMVGEDLLVLPVYTEGDTEITGYFPKGKWKHVFTGKTIIGGHTFKVPAPIGEPAVYVKEGGVWSERIFNSIQSAIK